MPPRNAPPSRATTAAGSFLWISDRLLKDAFDRFAATCVSRRSYSSAECVRQSRRYPASDHLHTNSATSIRTHSQISTFQRQCRQAHNAPGPLEARRRGHRRRLNYASAGVQSGTVPLFDTEVLLNDFWRRPPKQPYWEYQPPNWQPSKPQEPLPTQENSTDGLPAWLRHGLEYPREDDSGEDRIANLSTFETQLADLGKIEDVIASYKQLDFAQSQDPTYSIAACHHVVRSLREEAKSSGSVQTHQKVIPRLVDFAFETGHWLEIAPHLVTLPLDLAKTLKPVAEGGLYLYLIRTLARTRRLPDELLEKTLRSLDQSWHICQLKDEGNVAIYTDILADLFATASPAIQADLRSTVLEIKGVKLRLLTARSFATKLDEEAISLSTAETNSRVSVICNLLRNPESCARSEVTEKLLVIVQDLLAAVVQQQQVRTLQHHNIQTLLRFAIHVPGFDPTTEYCQSLARNALRCVEDSDDHVMCQETLDLLTKYAREALNWMPTTAEPPVEASAQSIVVELFQNASPAAAHRWFLHTAAALIRYTPGAWTKIRLDVLNKWLHWGACSKQICKRQRNMRDPAVRKFFRALLVVYQPQEVPEAFQVYEKLVHGAQATCRILLQHEIEQPHVFTPATSDPWVDISRRLRAVPKVFESRLVEYQREHHLRVRIRQQRLQDWTCTEDRLRQPSNVGEAEPQELSQNALLVSESSKSLETEQPAKLPPSGIYPYLALLMCLEATGAPQTRIRQLLLQMLKLLSGLGKKRWVLELALAATQHLRIGHFSSSLNIFVADYMNKHSADWPTECGELFSALPSMTVAHVPNLAKNLIAAHRSRVHPVEIKHLFHKSINIWTGQPPRCFSNRAPIDEIGPSRPLSYQLVDQLHSAALLCARASRFSTTAAFNLVYELHSLLTQHGAKKDARISRALVIAGLLRPIREGISYKIAPPRFRELIEMVRELEGEDVERRIDEIARKTELRESAALRKAGLNLIPGFEDDKDAAIWRHRMKKGLGDESDGRNVPWMKMQREREWHSTGAPNEATHPENEELDGEKRWRRLRFI